MKKSILILFLGLGLFACKNQTESKSESKSKSSTIFLKGSDTVLPVGQKTSEDYMINKPEASVTVVGGGSGTGITALLDGTADIAMASREIKGEEKLKFNEKNIALEVKTVAVDALAVVVHPDNKIDQLTREQLESIFTGEVANWKELGGDDEPIVVYSRETSSGTYEFFKKHVMSKKNYASSVLNMPATGAIVQSVSQTKGAIGYIGLAYMTDGVKALSVSYDGETYIEPSMETAKDQSYPITRPLYYIINKEKMDHVKDYVEFCLSATGQKIVEEVGYIPVQ